MLCTQERSLMPTMAAPWASSVKIAWGFKKRSAKACMSLGDIKLPSPASAQTFGVQVRFAVLNEETIHVSIF